MAGRPITNNSRHAQQKRERMREVREAMKERPVSFDHRPLMKAIRNWNHA